MKLLGRVVDYLAERHVSYAVIGGLALAVHGVARATFDSDLLVLEKGVLDPSLWEGVAPSGSPEIRQ